MRQQHSTHHAGSLARGRTGPRFGAVLGVLALVIMAGTSVAGAQPVTDSPRWTTTPTGRQSATLNDIDAEPGVTWAVGTDLVDGFQDVRPLALRWDGKRWRATKQPMSSNSSLESVAVAGANDVWAVGEDRDDPSLPKPLVMHWNGSAWQLVPGPAVPTGSFDEVQVAPDGSIWTAGWASIDGKEHAVVYRYARGAWQPLTTGLEESINGNALTVIANNDAWLGLNAGLAHYDGKSWKLTDDVPADGSQIPTALAAAGPKDIWAVGVNHGSTGELPLVLHYDGSDWTQVATPGGSAQLYDVALRNGHPVAVGERFEDSGNTILFHPFVLEYRGSKFVEATSPTDAQGTLSTADVSGPQLWTAGLTLDNSTGQFNAFAAVAR